MDKKKLLLLLTLILISFKSVTSHIERKCAIQNFVKHPSLRHGQVSIAVIDLETDTSLASYNANQSLIPASSQKVVVTGVALKILGKDFKFKTELLYDGIISPTGILRGNIIIRGFGDPTLGSSLFDKTKNNVEILDHWVQVIKKAGIKEIKGFIIGDANYFGTEVSGTTWLWEDLGNYYGAGAWGLNFHENLYKLKLKRNQQLGKQPTLYNTSPEVPNLYLVNELHQAEKGSGDNAYIFGAPYGNTHFVRGSIPIGKSIFTIKGAVPDPPFFAAYHLLRRLESSGISTSHRAGSLLQLTEEGFELQQTTVLDTHHSPSLENIVKITNHKSINLYCEALLRILGRHIKGEGTPSSGLEVIKDYLNKQEISTEGVFLEDASGLSPRNAISANFLAQFMQKQAIDKNTFEIFKNTLPIGGKTGTLKYMFKSSNAVGKILAKSGGMNRVKSYTGYAKTKTNKWLAFSIIANNFTGKSKDMTKLMEKLMISFTK